MEDTADSDSESESPNERCNKLVSFSEQTNLIYIHIIEGNLMLPLLLCVFLLL